LNTLRAHKFRSVLTVLGVLMGVATIILVASILAGLESQVRSMATQFGTRTIYISKFPLGPRGRLTPEMRRRKPLTYADAIALRRECPDVEDAAAELIDFDDAPPVVKYQAKQMLDANVAGEMSNVFGLLDISLSQGRAFTAIDAWHRRKVTVIGADVAARLFPNQNPVGKHIVIGGNTFLVIGTMVRRKEFFVDTGDNRWVFLPYGTYHEIYPAIRDNFLLAEAYPGKINEAIDEITGVLRRLRQDKPSQPDSFDTATAQSFIRQFNAMIATLAVALIVIASIGLLIGGIGVMNIMLVSVTERTREIGVRKAIGARRSDIAWQFLLEAATLTGAGGVVGVVIGYAGAFLLKLLFPSLPARVPLWSVVAAIVVSVSIGLFFGLWPATKAARLNPIEALRYE
ncbi:MAG: ABC transporter permease, partial [Terriglobia bacterium]